MCRGLSQAVALSRSVLVWQSGSSDVQSSGQRTPRCVSCGTQTRPAVPPASPSVVLCTLPLCLTGPLPLHLPVGEEPAFLPCHCRGWRCPRSAALRSRALPAAPVGPGLPLAPLAACQSPPPGPGDQCIAVHSVRSGQSQAGNYASPSHHLVLWNPEPFPFSSTKVKEKKKVGLRQFCDLCSLLSVTQDLTGLCPRSLALRAARRYPKRWQTAFRSHCGSALATAELFPPGNPSVTGWTDDKALFSPGAPAANC